MTAKAELANCTRCSMQLTPGEPYVLLCHPARRVPASGRPREAYPDGRQGLPAVRVAWLHDGRACALACVVLACACTCASVSASMRVRVRGLLAAWGVRKRQRCVRARVRACKCYACIMDASALCMLCVMAALLHVVMPVVLTLHHLLCVGCGMARCQRGSAKTVFVVLSVDVVSCTLSAGTRQLAPPGCRGSAASSSRSRSAPI